MEEKNEQLNTENIEKQTQETITNQKVTQETIVKNEELQPQVIGEIAQEKQKGAFWVIIFFGLLIGFTFGLPYLREYLENKKAPVNNIVNKNKENKEKEQEEKKDEQVYYEVDQNVTFAFEDLRFNNISKEYSDDYYLLFDLTNTKDETYNFDENYYIELYTAEKTLLERAKLVSDAKAMNNQALRIKLPISENSYNNVILISIVKKTLKDYPEVVLNSKQDDYNVLTCDNSNNQISYYFKEDKLVKISDVYNYTLVDINSYNEILKTKQNLAASYNNVVGVSSNITDSNSSFTMNTQIDLETANINNLNNKYYYKKNTVSKTVKFEMEAMRYTCK